MLEFYGIEELMPETWNEPAGQFIATAQSPNSAVQTVAASPPTIARSTAHTHTHTHNMQLRVITVNKYRLL